jgi:hypothetical protein
VAAAEFDVAIVGPDFDDAHWRAVGDFVGDNASGRGLSPADNRQSSNDQERQV